MEIPSQESSKTLNAANEYVEHFCADNDVSMGHTMKLSLIVEELVTNTLEHGGLSTGSPIELDLNKQADTVTLVYTDRGIAFNPLTDLDLSDPVDGVEGSIGGWGWPLIKRYCETITYGRDNETNRLKMVLSLVD